MLLFDFFRKYWVQKFQIVNNSKTNINERELRKEIKFV